ncbi:MAG: DUF3784 domain-containing protein [Firmicutes bacterium]|jgi:hypothetical protein|nr:DUF3784 domain-containing protein [Bacillota bacterium]
MWIVSIVIGLFLVLLGFLLRFFKMVEILSGYNPEKVTDKDELANWTGSNIILMGVLILFIGVLNMVLPDLNGTPSVIALIFIILGLSIRTSVGCRRYEKR